MERRILEFNGWKNINESNSDKIVNALSKLFGGKVSKLDSILSDIKKAHSDYADEWEDVITDIDSIEVEKTQANSDPAETKKLDRMTVRKKQLLDALTVKKNSDIKNLESKAQKIHKDNVRLKSYWEAESSKLSAELAEEMYKRAKDLSDDTTSKELYSKYEKALLRAKEKEESFRKKYGEIVDRTKSTAKHKTFNFSLDPYLKMDQESFEKEVKDMDKNQIISLLEYLRTERNERYAMMDTEKESLERKSALPKSEIDRRIKEISSGYMREIRDLRTKITIAKRYV